MKMDFEYELNRKWIYGKNKDEDAIGETNFVVSADWLIGKFEELNKENKFTCDYTDFEEFVGSYEPEIDGELIYQAAVKENVLIEDIGIVMYS